MNESFCLLIGRPVLAYHPRVSRCGEGEGKGTHGNAVSQGSEEKCEWNFLELHFSTVTAPRWLGWEVRHLHKYRDGILRVVEGQ